MENFEWNLPTKIAYGRGELDRLVKVSEPYGKKAFLATYRRKASRAWFLDKTVASLQRRQGCDRR